MTTHSISYRTKIIDEDRNNHEEVNFQWFDNDTHEKLQTRLNDLYKEGMKRFLDIEVTDYSDKQLENKLYNINEPEVKKQIQEMFQHLRLQKNPEFAFKEVFNEESFYDNGAVIKEVVELLQPYRFRYGHKQQFLGDFFELLLNTSIKQEAGQFFTPVPIAKFIISCLPIREFIDNKINSNDGDLLPVSIDYAAGSGHFLTELMDEIQAILNNIDTTDIRPTGRSKINGWKQNQFEWAKEFIYGIEADYRLVKTTKVSSFLNGDGEAIIIRADGLDNFKKSKDYKLKLKEVSHENSQDNAQFDILVANPPYSVSAFKNTLKFGDESFELFNRLTDDSSEIECLFIERAKQLLKPGGWAGVILPSSILSNSGIYTDAREIILKFFKLKAIAEFGSNTFMATGTNTVTLFLERKSNNDWKKIETAIKNFFNKPKEATINGIEKAFGKYVSTVFEGIELTDYISLVIKKPNENIKKQELYNNYETWFESLTEIKQLKEKKTFKDKTKVNQQAELDKLFFEKVFAKEQDKMLYYFLVYPQKTVLIKVGEKQAEKDFIGYEFSSRRGHEGIKMYRDENGKPTTKLYDEDNPLNSEKANSYVYGSFLNKNLSIDKSLEDNIINFNTLNLFDFGKFSFEKSISLGEKKKIDFNSVWKSKDLVLLTSIANIQKGTSITKANTVEGEIPVVAGGQDAAYYHNVSNRNANLITVSASGAYSGFLNYWEQPIFASDCNTIVSKNEQEISTKLIYLFLKSIQDFFYMMQRGQAQPHVYASDIEKVKIPVPPKSIQEKIIKEISVLEQREKAGIEKGEKLKKQIYELFLSENSKGAIKKLEEVCEMKAGQFKSPSDILPNNAEGLYPCFGGNGFRGYTKTYTHIGKYPLVGRQGALCGNVHYVDGQFHATEHALVVKALKDINVNWLYYLLKSMNLNKYATGTAQPGLSVKKINPLLVKVLTLKEQEKLIDKIKKLENEILVIETDLANMDNKKKQILRKYLK